MIAKQQSSVADFKSRALAPAVILVVLLRAIAAFTPAGRLWGVDFLRTFEPVTILCLALLPLPALIPSVRRGVARLTPMAAELLFFAVVLGGLCLMILHPMRTFYYGDGSILVPEVTRVARTPSVHSDILLNLKSSPLAGVVVERCAAWGPSILVALGFGRPDEPTFAFQLFGMLNFLCLVAVLIIYERATRRLILFLAICGTGGAVLFFGYAEFYAAAFVAMVWYALAAERYVSGEGRLRVLMASFVVAVLCHYYMVVLLPALLWSIAERRGWAPAVFSSTKRMLLIVAGATIGGVILYFAAGWYDSGSRIVIPMIAQHGPAGIQAYTLLSPAHLVDLLNVPLLIAPVATLFLAVEIPTIGGRRFLETSQFRTDALAGMAITIFFWFANTSLGLARDWDLTAPAGVMLTFTALRLMRSAAGKKAAGSLVVFSVASILSVAPWIALHLNHSHSTRRFTQLVELDAGIIYGDYALSGYEALRKRYLHTGDLDNEIRTTQKMIDILHYPQHYILLHQASEAFASGNPVRHLALQHWLLGRLEYKAARLRAVGRDSDYGSSLKSIDSLATMIAAAALNHRIVDSLSPDLERVCAATGRKTPFLLLDGLHALGADRFPEAASSLSSARAAGFESNRLKGLCGVAMLHTPDARSGQALIDASLRTDPNDPVLHYYLAYTLLVLDTRIPEAARHLREVMRLVPGTEIAQRAALLLAKIS
jgi:hypothetical protein